MQTFPLGTKIYDVDTDSFLEANMYLRDPYSGDDTLNNLFFYGEGTIKLFGEKVDGIRYRLVLSPNDVVTPKIKVRLTNNDTRLEIANVEEGIGGGGKFRLITYMLFLNINVDMANVLQSLKKQHITKIDGTIEEIALHLEVENIEELQHQQHESLRLAISTKQDLNQLKLSPDPRMKDGNGWGWIAVDNNYEVVGFGVGKYKSTELYNRNEGYIPGTIISRNPELTIMGCQWSIVHNCRELPEDLPEENVSSWLLSVFIGGKAKCY